MGLANNNQNKYVAEAIGKDGVDRVRVSDVTMLQTNSYKKIDFEDDSWDDIIQLMIFRKN